MVEDLDMLVTMIAWLWLPLAAQAGQTVPDANPATAAATPDAEFWDNVYAGAGSVFNTAPNAFLVSMVKGLKPGRALDIAMGQGRNSVYLAKLGWDVWGFDIAERGMELARKSAAAAGVKITTFKATLEDFNYGTNRWDLIVGTYVGVRWLDAAVKSLRPGGFLIIEGYAEHPRAPAGAAFGPNELLKLILNQKLRVICYEDVKGEPDWMKLDGVVRIFASKPASLH